MKEEYLHLIWKQKRLPFHLMKLITGEKFQILNVGIHNNESGPDFFCGEVVIDNYNWIGNIELHVKSSDWNLHNHQLDKAYNNVILHVVYEYDKPIYINGRLLPTLVLKEYLDVKHFEKYLNSTLKYSEFMCEKNTVYLDSIYLESMKQKVIINRIDRKINFISLIPNLDFNQVFYLFIANAFGMKVNSIPFQELANTLTLKMLHRERKENYCVLILGVSGLLDKDNLLFSKLDFNFWNFTKQKYSFISMDKFIWKKKGLRPSGFPEKRLLQFSKFIENFNFDTCFTDSTSKEILVFLKSVFHKINSDSCNLKFSKGTIELIITNGFIPFIWWLGNYKNDFELKEKSIEILSLMNSESNATILKWTKIGVKNENAYDSQALLEIYNHFCSKKKCLFCDVGNKILDK